MTAGWTICIGTRLWSPEGLIALGWSALFGRSGGTAKGKGCQNTRRHDVPACKAQAEKTPGRIGAACAGWADALSATGQLSARSGTWLSRTCGRRIEDAPSRAILGAGAGSFALTRVYETEGITLMDDDLTAEMVAARFADIGANATQEELTDAFSQTRKYALNAAQARGLKLDW